MSKKIFVIGGSGMVGSTILEYAKNFKLYATYNKNPIKNKKINSFQIDLINNKKGIEKIINEIKPDVTIHTAAHPSVDLCEKNHEITDNLHVKATKDIANICSKINSKLIYLSTDAVFDGKSSTKYIETDTPNPVNYYGLTKLHAEKIVLEASKNNVILRTAVIYGNHPKSRFTNWIIQTLTERKTVDPHIDQFNTPTLVDDLVNAIMKIISMNVTGLFHATGKTCVNRYEFAIELALKFNLEKKLIKPVTTFEKKQFAVRPKKTCLDSTKLEKILKFHFKDIKEGISIIYDKN